MTEPAEKEKKGENGAKPEAPQAPAPAPAQQQATYRAAIVPQQLMQQIIDLIRDEPIPRKKTDPVVAAIERCQYADIPVNKVG